MSVFPQWSHARRSRRRRATGVRGATHVARGHLGADGSRRFARDVPLEDPHAEKLHPFSAGAPPRMFRSYSPRAIQSEKRSATPLPRNARGRHLVWCPRCRSTGQEGGVPSVGTSWPSGLTNSQVACGSNFCRTLGTTCFQPDQAQVPRTRPKSLCAEARQRRVESSVVKCPGPGKS